MTFAYALKEMMIGAISCLLLVAMIGLTYSPNPTVHRAEAIGSGSVVFVGGGIGTIQETLSAIANTALRMKELVLDPIAWFAANIIIQRMTQDIVRWINSGFQGEPAFMRDFGGFLTSIADQAVGEFISSDETLRFLCSPFRLDIRYALSLQYAKSRNYGSPGSACTLTGVTANLENFFNVNTIAGGWDQWFKVTQDPQYNPYGALLLAQEQMTARLANTKGQQAELLGWGKGFLSSQECTVVENRNICRTVTPGSTIEEALNDALGSPSRRIAAADEINEIIVALFSQLVTQAFNGAGGLLGLTGGGSGPVASAYFTQLSRDTVTASPISSTTNPLQTAITNETTYRALAQSMVTDIEAAANYRETYYPGDSCHSGALTTDLQNALTRARDGVTSATNNLNTLNVLLARYNAAIGQPNAVDLQNAVLQEFLQLQATGSLHMEPDIAAARSSYIPEVQRLIRAFEASIDQACNRFQGQ